MKAPIVTCGLSGLLLVSAAYAQDGFFRRPARPSAAAPKVAPPAAEAPKTDSKVYQTESVLPGPTAPDQIKPATIALPTDAIEPWLLTKEAGPFMVLAKTFRGPEAERYALALAIELRRDYKLPAFILRTKDFPRHSLIRNIPPTAPSYVNKARLTEPERVRSYDEAAVLVGNEKTLAASEKLLHEVKKIRPKCLEAMPSIFDWRSHQGLSSAVRTTNPYQPTQNLFPGKVERDAFVDKINNGPHNVFRCPGRYSLQVAQFTGRSVFNPSEKDDRWFGDNWHKKSPLATAYDDAEELAALLAKDPKVRAAGAQPYVYHDRTSSKVMLGSFGTPNDPAAVQLRNLMLKIGVDFSAHNKSIIVAPATLLTDLEDPNQPIKVR